MMVAPGNIIHMDENGAVRFPAERLDEVLWLCQELNIYEKRKQTLLAQCRDPEEMGRIMNDNYR